MSKKSLQNLGQIYGNMLNNVQVVKEQTLPKKVGPGAKELNDKGAADLQDGGPSEKGGFKEADIDPKKMKGEKENKFDKKDLTSEEDEESVEKMSQRAINNFMSKSIFDKLYENVMSSDFQMGSEDAESMELDALGIDTEGEGAGGEEMGGEDEVTITLSKDLAQKLHDVLMGVLGGETKDLGDEGEGEGEMEGGEEDEEEIGHAGVNAKAPDMGKDNKVKAQLKPGSGKGGDGKYTDTVDGNAGEEGHALVNAKKPDMGKDNKVKSTKTSKPGEHFFASK